jgi:hypothetical protein
VGEYGASAPSRTAAAARALDARVPVAAPATARSTFMPITAGNPIARPD